MLDLRQHRIKLALVEPQIAANTGNIGRLCVATGTELHLVRPYGFVLSDKNLKRSGMDYWDRLKLIQHDDVEAFWKAVGSDAFWLLSSKGTRSIWEAPFRDGDWLILGNETLGLNESLLSAYPERLLRIPQVSSERCLNLSTAAGIAVYEALRRINLTSLP
jgi:tRNA (cytidine/uridine-2'-O-)-methyltransferase